MCSKYAVRPDQEPGSTSKAGGRKTRATSRQSLQPGGNSSHAQLSPPHPATQPQPRPAATPSAALALALAQQAVANSRTRAPKHASAASYSGPGHVYHVVGVADSGAAAAAPPAAATPLVPPTRQLQPQASAAQTSARPRALPLTPAASLTQAPSTATSSRGSKAINLAAMSSWSPPRAALAGPRTGNFPRMRPFSYSSPRPPPVPVARPDLPGHGGPAPRPPPTRPRPHPIPAPQHPQPLQPGVSFTGAPHPVSQPRRQAAGPRQPQYQLDPPPHLPHPTTRTHSPLPPSAPPYPTPSPLRTHPLLPLHPQDRLGAPHTPPLRSPAAAQHTSTPPARATALQTRQRQQQEQPLAHPHTHVPHAHPDSSPHVAQHSTAGPSSSASAHPQHPHLGESQSAMPPPSPPHTPRSPVQPSPAQHSNHAPAATQPLTHVECAPADGSQTPLCHPSGFPASPTLHLRPQPAASMMHPPQRVRRTDIMIDVSSWQQRPDPQEKPQPGGAPNPFDAHGRLTWSCTLTRADVADILRADSEEIAHGLTPPASPTASIGDLQRVIMRVPSPAPSPRTRQSSPHPQHPQNAQRAQHLQQQPLDGEQEWAVRLPPDPTLMATTFGDAPGGASNRAPDMHPDGHTFAIPFGDMGMPMGAFPIHTGQIVHAHGSPSPTPPGSHAARCTASESGQRPLGHGLPPSSTGHPGRGAAGAQARGGRGAEAGSPGGSGASDVSFDLYDLIEQEYIGIGASSLSDLQDLIGSSDVDSM